MKRKTLRGEITAFILVIISCITIAACAVSYRFIYHSMVANGMNYSRQLSEQLCSNIDFLFSSVEDGTDSLAQSPYMRYYGSHFLTVSVPGTSADKIKKTLWETSLANQNIDDLSLVYNGRKVSSLFNLYPQSVLTHVVQYYDRSDVLSQSRFVPLMYESRTGVRSLSCVRAIYSDSPSNDLCIVTSIRVDAILSLLQKVDLGENSGSCLTDAAGNIQYSTAVDDPFIAGMQKLLQAKKIADGQTFLDRIDGTEYLFSANAVGNSNLFAVIYIPLRTITRPITTLWQMILVVVGTLFSLSCLLTIWFSDRMTLPIRKLSKHMQEDSGRTLHVIEPSSDEQEIRVLYSTYNDLIEKTEQLMELNQQESRQKRKAELQALQYQINPHFLYNTLDSINAMAVLKDENEISEMTTALASLMRLSLSQKEEFVTLENELKHVRAYIDIQKIRYSNRFQVSFSVDESILQHRVVRLILQPLVENAIRHGLEPKEEEGNLAVRAFACGKWIVLQVWDDGVIVDPETVKQIARNLKDHKKPDPESSHSIGLYNVNERIRLYYNDAGSMYFQSNAHCGTTVSILIPADMKGGNR